MVFRLNQFRKLQNARIAALTEAGERTSLEVAKFIQLNAKRLAPRDTGETIRGIRRRPLANGGWVVESIVKAKGKKGFRQNMWSNQSRPHKRPRMHWPRFGDIPQPVLYGVGHRITGKPRWWTISVERGRKRIGQLFRTNTRNALRARINA